MMQLLRSQYGRFVGLTAVALLLLFLAVYFFFLKSWLFESATRDAVTQFEKQANVLLEPAGWKLVVSYASAIEDDKTGQPILREAVLNLQNSQYQIAIGAMRLTHEAKSNELTLLSHDVTKIEINGERYAMQHEEPLGLTWRRGESPQLWSIDLQLSRLMDITDEQTQDSAKFVFVDSLLRWEHQPDFDRYLVSLKEPYLQLHKAPEHLLSADMVYSDMKWTRTPDKAQPWHVEHITQLVKFTHKVGVVNDKEHTLHIEYVWDGERLPFYNKEGQKGVVSVKKCIAYSERYRLQCAFSAFFASGMTTDINGRVIADFPGDFWMRTKLYTPTALQPYLDDLAAKVFSFPIEGLHRAELNILQRDGGEIFLNNVPVKLN
jgi:hypothetical protein